MEKVVNSFGRANGLDAKLRDALYRQISRALNGRPSWQWYCHWKEGLFNYIVTIMCWLASLRLFAICFVLCRVFKICHIKLYLELSIIAIFPLYLTPWVLSTFFFPSAFGKAFSIGKLNPCLLLSQGLVLLKLPFEQQGPGLLCCMQLVLHINMW